VIVTVSRGKERHKMKTFTIDAENKIIVFASKKEAAASSTTPFDPFTNETELAELTAEWPVQRLVEIWNGIPGVTPVTKFKSRKIASERIWGAIQDLGATRAPAAEPEAVAPEEVQPAPQAITEETVEPGSDEPAAVAEQDAAVPAEPGESAPAQVEPEAPETVAPAEPVANVDATVPDVAPAEDEPTKKAGRAKKAPKVPKVAKAAKSESGPREGTKTAQVVTMLRREGGATLAEIMTTMGWQKHTVRGFMAGAMKKAGYEVESFKPEGGERSYRINK